VLSVCLLCAKTHTKQTDRLQHLGPESLEGTVFLRMNSKFWLRSAPQIMQEILYDEKVRAEAVKNRKSIAVSTAIISDVTVDLFLE